jgi:hypothetical protein
MHAVLHGFVIFYKSFFYLSLAQFHQVLLLAAPGVVEGFD